LAHFLQGKDQGKLCKQSLAWFLQAQVM